MHADAAPSVQMLCDTLRQPRIELKSCRTTKSVWDLFKAHHYLIDTINCSSRCTLFVWEQRSFDNSRVIRTELVGFVGSLIQPGAHTKDMRREAL